MKEKGSKPHAQAAAAAAVPHPRAQPGEEHVSALVKAIAGFAKRKTEAVVNPKLGSSFVSLGEAYEIYNIYSWESGFGIRYGESSLDSQGSKCMQKFVCACEGKPTKYNNSPLSCECTASIRLLRSTDSGWYVCEHQVGHNHTLSRACKEKLSWRSHTSINKNTRDLIRQLRENNVPVIAEIGAENPQFDDFRNTMETFTKIRVKDPLFNYTFQIDNDCRVTTLLWTSIQNSTHYHSFGDVITFDTTYRSNMYEIPFGLFVGVNNNFETILLGGVLMTDEKVDSFKWVFSQFFQLMGGKQPQTILTDRCGAIEDAIQEVLPSTTHRWCKWQVLGMAKDFLGSHYTKESMFRVEFHRILNDMLTTDEFERAWEMLLQKYGLENHPFLMQIYEVRHKWVKAYFSDTFCAKQTSTQKCESARHLLKEYVPWDCSMELFVKQYEKLRSDQDLEDDFEEKSTSINEVVLRTNLPIEKHASEVYTRAVYELFVQTIYESEPYVVEAVIPNLKYKAWCPNSETREKWSRVEYEVNVREEGEAFMCVCKQFEHTGMLCCHAVKVMVHLGVHEIPRSHIVPRWTVEPLRCWMHRAHPQKDTCWRCRRFALYDKGIKIMRRASRDDRSFEIAMKHMDRMQEIVSQMPDV
ncbi:protein FAR-RED IMPAIRED RESPONSE 1-like [Lolium rigidum]|uniref:protein FAR-RED IMPAIRED RESPONSE 1-like n=1 Tax=Lolium rigidum TaxID=89674 RepID=UPI001F5C7E8B|nr:protein FAR-RED IMPAIRED RESPONSE 1-like [Lolium rigidum]